MNQSLPEPDLDQLFRTARSYNRWSQAPVPEATLHALYELVKFGPTSMNCCPARFVFVTGREARKKLVGCLSPGNVIKVEQAPVTVIIGMDEKFYDKFPILFPQRPEAAEGFKDPTVARVTMMRNSSLQAGYFIMAARALGLDCGPMSGFQNDKVDAEFFAGTSVKSNMLCVLGTGTTENLHPRNPRLSFEDACSIV